MIGKISDKHLRTYHNQMALESLNELGDESKLSQDEEGSVKEYWKRFGYKSHGEWHRLYKCANSFDKRYVPNDVYGLELLPRLNAPALLSAWDDKSYYPRFFS